MEYCPAHTYAYTRTHTLPHVPRGVRGSHSDSVWLMCGNGVFSCPLVLVRIHTNTHTHTHTRGIVAFNFSPRNLTQVTSAMKPVQDSMVGFASVKRITLQSSRRVILRIELELNNVNSILSRSAVTLVFPLPLAQAKAFRG